MQDKTHRHVAPWPNFNDATGGYVYRNSVSEPMVEREARRMQAAMGGHIEAIPSIEEPELESDAQVAADREDAGMLPEASNPVFDPAGSSDTPAPEVATEAPEGAAPTSDASGTAKAPSRGAGGRRRTREG